VIGEPFHSLDAVGIGQSEVEKDRVETLLFTLADRLRQRLGSGHRDVVRECVVDAPSDLFLEQEGVVVVVLDEEQVSLVVTVQ